METMEAIAARKSVRRYLRRPVEERKIDTVVQAGLMAAKSAQLDIMVITSRSVLRTIADETRRRFLASGNKFLIDRASEPGYDPLYAAPCMIVFSARRTSSALIATNDVASAACAAQNMMLAATDIGLGSCYLAGPVAAFASEEMLKLVGIDTDESVLCTLIIGYPLDTAPHEPRPPATNVRYCKDSGA